VTRRARILCTLLACAAHGLAGCTIDTELGLAAEVTGATLVVDRAADRYVARVTVAFRVGENAQGVREFVPLRVDAEAGATVATASSFDRPVGFSGVLSPGDSRTVTFVGECLGGCNAAALCGAGGSVPIDFFWEDRGVSPPKLGQTSGTATIDCPP
jgi:hypothetical protein